MSEKQKYIDFEAYERVAEPHKRERVSAWRTAIGLQDVDGLRVSDYLKETAVRYIEGDITIDEVREQLRSYYVNKTPHDLSTKGTIFIRQVTRQPPSPSSSEISAGSKRTWDYIITK